MALPAEGTLLILDGMGVPLYAARGLKQTLSQIGGQIERSINGKPLDFSPDWAKLFASEISCSDQRAVMPDNLWRGDLVTVSCVAELHYPVAGAPARSKVPNAYGSGIDTRTEGNFVYYRPVLDMFIVDLSSETDEYGAVVSWKLSLEEVAPDEGSA